MILRKRFTYRCRATQQDATYDDLRLRLSQSIEQRFTYGKTEYLADVEREIQILWDDEEQTRVCLKQLVTFKLIPLGLNETIRWVSERTAEPHLTLEDYTKEIIRVTINGRSQTMSQRSSWSTRVELNGELTF